MTCQFWTLFCRPSQSWSSANDTNTSTACGHSRRGPEQVSVSPWVRDALMFIHAHVNDNESNLVSSLNLHACVWVFLTAQMYCAWAKLPPNITWQPMFCNNEAYFRVFFCAGSPWNQKAAQIRSKLLGDLVKVQDCSSQSLVLEKLGHTHISEYVPPGIRSRKWHWHMFFYVQRNKISSVNNSLGYTLC